jgi:16S rRNA (guanine527-N7)-methyltransferase
MSDASNAESFSREINRHLLAASLPPLDPAQAEKFGNYLALIVRWNARTNLTAVREENGIIERHFVECIASAHALPRGIATLLDFGSGAGFPGIPIALCRSEIAVTLAESQGKKAAFLREAVRVLGLAAKVHSGRAEELHEQFDCVTLRAVDRMQFAVTAAANLVRQGGWLAPLTTNTELDKMKAAGGNEFIWNEPTSLPGSESRVLVLGQKELALTLIKGPR